jgi:hypothetical protein
LRAALAEIAADECRHAQLSWDVHAWLVSLLGPDEITAVERARAEAVAGLGAEIGGEPASELVYTAGVPTARDARLLHSALFGELAKNAA